jgi:DNA-binding transcriptional ArsR family regulator
LGFTERKFVAQGRGIIESQVLAQAAEVIKCLGHPLRLRLREALEVGEKTVTELQDYAGATQTAVSQQLASLRGRQVVDCRREGSFVYYRIIQPKVPSILDCIRHCEL